MARTDDDSWDLASSVGATATMVAAARAMVTRIDGALISDPYAEPLVRAVGVDVFTRLATGELDPAAFDIDDDKNAGMDRMVDNMAVRTKFFDDFFLEATAAGVDQAVILASGLDSRAYRLQWPAGTVVYEVDQPQVIAFKTKALADIGAEPTAERRVVAIDLRFDWPAALKEAGFDPDKPTAWSAEGLLGYLPPEAQDKLLDTVTTLSVPGSRLATESAPPLDQLDVDEAKERMELAAERWREHGYDLDWANLVYLGDRNEPADYLTARGWTMNSSKINELLTAHGYPPFDGDTPFSELRYIRGTLGGSGPMTRADADSWDIASSVGATATMVAAARAIASREPDALIDDPFAEPLVRAVGMDFFNRLLDGEVGLTGDDDGATRLLTNVMAVRTRFFDDFFLQATESGIRQAVILASGLDARGYRLRWPAGTVVYEIDQPKVIEFKNATMASIDAEPTATRRAVSVDLREDWPAALRSNGFDDSEPTAWSAEGLLVYLPPDAQDRLFDDIAALSAPGSRLATEYHPDAGASMGQRAEAFRERWRKHGFDLNLADLFYPGERNPVVEYLTDHGWQVTARSRPEMFTEYGRHFPDDEGLAPMRGSLAVTAIRQ